MSIVIESSGQTARLTLDGELTIYEVAEIKAGLADVMRAADEIEIDLGGIAEIDTAGLQLMLIAKRNPGKRVRFVNHPPCVLRLIDLANLGGLLGDPLFISATESARKVP
ncbi:MAG: STAS domain-containing protein [Candidatus Accumulibacter phosphatis]|jgi:anti-sigma B factor antagonist|uniref:Anti-anti-sigma factor n=2 Tax=Candidatus Accumulibacter TaxID=327159 RepID=A0A080M5M3_9PROT|nr:MULTISPECIES: STAS domain-containing protein [Candidatus Accumulibacter]KFB72369.1 MAG: anti-anti-sigma factor [Candidatus Accumulibacter phosphatis]NMQ05671.1 STAS domain-containing protein [Candidatus Accumulibacter contiguus]